MRRKNSYRSSCGRLFGVVAMFGHWASIQAESPVPESWPRERYTALGARSPFALATAAPVPAMTHSFAANWFISGLGRVNDEDFVSIKSRDLSTQFTLHGRGSYRGVSLASVHWSDTVGRSTVILTKGTETAKLEFNEAEVRNALATENGKSRSAEPAAAEVAESAGLVVTRKRIAPIKAPR